MVYAHYPNRRGLLNKLKSSPKAENYYPSQSMLNVSFLNQGLKPNLKIKHDTAIASIGSCFAREIRRWLIDQDYNFIQTASGPGTGAGSARYDRVYSTFSIRQEFERAFGHFDPLVKYWEIEENGETHILDPHRYTIAWDTHDERIREQQEHKEAVYKAFTHAKVIIITVGQGEIWYDERDGSVFPVLPPLEIFDPEIHKFKASTYSENLDNLRQCFKLLKAHNPEAHLIITTSPVPLKVTFTEKNSIIANNAMKSLLRAMVDEFVQESGPNVSYFPAYELVTQLIPNSFSDDGRHVTRETVNSIMSLFEDIYLTDQQSKSLHTEELLELRSQGQWAQLTAALGDLNLDHVEEKQRLLYLDLYGEACLFMNRLEEGADLLLKSRQLHQAMPQYQSFLETVSRNNLILAALGADDIQLAYSLVNEIVKYPNAPKNIIINWLNALKLKSLILAIEYCTDLMSNIPQLHDSTELIDWLQNAMDEFN